MIKAQGLVFHRGKRKIIDSIDFNVLKREVVGIVGPNGSGKSTVLGLLYGLLKPSSGEVIIDGAPLKSYSPRQVAEKVAVVRQSEHSDIVLSVADTVLLGRIPHRSIAAAPKLKDYEACAEALNRMGIAAIAEQLMSQVSGGEAQRALIARALAQDTEVMLLDEPTNHLDLKQQHSVMQLLREFDSAVVVVLHDLNLAARYCDRILLLDKGACVALGTPAEVFSHETIRDVYGVDVRIVDLGNGKVHLIVES